MMDAKAAISIASSFDMCYNVLKYPSQTSSEYIHTHLKALHHGLEDRNMTEGREYSRSDVSLHVGGIGVFNSAMYHNGIQPIRKIQVTNHSQDPISGLDLVIIPETEILGEYRAPLPPILPGKPLKVDDPKLRVNGEKLAALTESITVNVMVAITQGETIVTKYTGEIRILTYDQWIGFAYKDYLASYVMPNHPVVLGLLHDAAMILESWGKDPSLEGYQREDPNRVLEQAAAIFAAIQKKNIVYSNPKASMWEPGQRIRTPEVIMDERLGTCMDFSLLYASCLEAIDLHCILYSPKGHIFVGVWLHETSFY